MLAASVDEFVVRASLPRGEVAGCCRVHIGILGSCEVLPEAALGWLPWAPGCQWFAEPVRGYAVDSVTALTVGAKKNKSKTKVCASTGASIKAS